MARLKVLVMASSWGTGLMFFLASLSLALKRIGLDVVVVSTEKEQAPGLKTKLRESGIKLYECKHVDSTSPWGIYRGTREISQIISEEDIDVVHANGVGHAIKAALARRLFKREIAIVESVHTYAHGLPQKRAWLLRRAPGLMNMCADIVAPCSEIVGEQLIEQGLSRAKNSPVHNGIDLVQFDIDIASEGSPEIQPVVERISGRPTVIYPSILVPRKGHHYLLEAASQVIAHYPEVQFIITNDGPIRSQLQQAASHLGIADNIIFTGRLKHKDLYLLLAKATIGAFPTLAELLPMAILDIMAAAKPIVASNVAGIPEMIRDGENGFLVQPRDSGALAARILELLRNPQKTQEMGARGRKLVEEKFTIDFVAAEFEKVYEVAKARANGRNMSKQV